MTDDHPPDDNPAPLLERALRSSIRRPSVGPPRSSSGRTLGICGRHVSTISSCRGALIAVSGNDTGALERNCGKCIAALPEL